VLALGAQPLFACSEGCSHDHAGDSSWDTNDAAQELTRGSSAKIKRSTAQEITQAAYTIVSTGISAALAASVVYYGLFLNKITQKPEADCQVYENDEEMLGTGKITPSDALQQIRVKRILYRATCSKPNCNEPHTATSSDGNRSTFKKVWRFSPANKDVNDFTQQVVNVRMHCFRPAKNHLAASPTGASLREISNMSRKDILYDDIDIE
jgi:hypothetical protein